MATKDALTQARHEAGMTQEELARKVYVNGQPSNSDAPRVPEKATNLA